MTILVTGAKGFIAKNLLAVLERDEQNKLLKADRSTSKDALASLLNEADVVVHLAGENRPADPSAFKKVNTELTAFILETLEKKNKPYKLLYSSSTQAAQDNEYGRSKKQAEELLQSGVKNGNAVIFRFPGVFGKWCKPNYNSVVATYCYNIANDLPIEVRDREYKFSLMYVDHVVSILIKHIKETSKDKVMSPMGRHIGPRRQEDIQWTRLWISVIKFLSLIENSFFGSRLAASIIQEGIGNSLIHARGLMQICLGISRDLLQD